MSIIYFSLVLLIIPGVLSDGSGFKAFKQNDYKVDLERIVMPHYNKRLVNYGSTSNFKYNRTCKAMNLTFNFKAEIGTELQVVVQFYKFLSNEYRNYPIRFLINACDAVAEDAFGVAAFKKCGNFTGCPLKKNVRYHACNWTIDQSKFPPLIPSGQYKVELQGLFRGEDVGTVEAYLNINRPVPIPKK